jgi:8-oxo-dGTP pyrophosphatase MutT (NUDIX family)
VTTAREFDPTTVPIRPAATVMLVRDASGESDAAGIEVFMLRRTLSAVFGSGMYVFPGGRVETSDGADVDRAHRRAAIRECFEEAGVLLARDRDGRTVADDHAAMGSRLAIYDGTADLVDVCAQHDLTLDLDELVWVSHWITPVGEARRFDTRFYLVPAPHGQSSTHDDTETIASLWIDPRDALRRQTSGELRMMPPTIRSLQFLSEFDTVSEAMAGARAKDPPSVIVPRLRVSAEGEVLGVSLPDDADYDGLA